MDSIKSFKGYGKVDELEEQAFRNKTRRRFIIIAVAGVVLILAIIGAVAATLIHRNSKDDGSIDAVPAAELTPSSSLRAVCRVTRYPDSCFSSISSFETTNTTDPEQLFKLSLQVVLRELESFDDFVNQTTVRANDAGTKAAMEVCSSVIDDAASSLNDSIALMDVSSDQQLLSAAKIDDLKTWLSTAITDLDTCLDSIEMNSTVVDDFKSKIENSTELASNRLAIVTRILGLLSNFNIPIHRKLLADFPEWIGAAERRLLAEASPTPNVTVAADGTGTCLTIKEAVAKVPKKSLSRFVIYVKAGTYQETVVMDKNKWNVMMYGDGMKQTIVTGSLNFVDGTPTFATATVEPNIMDLTMVKAEPIPSSFSSTPRRPGGKGRKKIVIEQIHDKNKQQVTFSKRRTGMFKKAAELCVLCGVEAAIIIFSPGGKVFCFGHPNAEATMRRFLRENTPSDEWGVMDCNENAMIEAHKLSVQKAVDSHKSAFEKTMQELEREKRAGAIEAEQRKQRNNQGFWWEETVNVEAMTIEELKQYTMALDQLKNMVARRLYSLRAAETSLPCIPLLPAPRTI